MIFAIEKVPFKSQAFLGDFQGQAGGKNLRGINPKFFVEFSSIKSEFFQKIPFEKCPSFVKNKGDPQGFFFDTLPASGNHQFPVN